MYDVKGNYGFTPTLMYWCVGGKSAISRHFLTYQDSSLYNTFMTTKISTIVDDKVWEDFKELAEEGHQSISGLLTEAMRDYLRKKRLRPEVLKHMEESIAENEELGRLLAK